MEDEDITTYRALKGTLRAQDKDVGPARRRHRKASRKLARAERKGMGATVIARRSEEVEAFYQDWLKQAMEAKEAREAVDDFKRNNPEAVRAFRQQQCNARVAAILDVAEFVIAVTTAGSPAAAIKAGTRMVLDHPDIPISGDNREDALALVESLVTPEGGSAALD